MRETTGRNRPQVDAVKKFAADTHVDLEPMELDGASQVSVDKGAALASRAVAAQPERSRTLGPYAAPYQPLAIRGEAHGNLGTTNGSSIPQKW
jgi:hypothetical protein